MEGYYRKPKVDWELLDDHSEGIIATTGCLGGHVLQELMRPDRHADESFDAALKKAGRLQDIFGRDNLFVELQDHGIPEQHRTNPLLLEIARKLGAPLLATNDSHYTHRHDAESHDALLCVQTGSLMGDADRFKFHGDDHYLKSAGRDARPVPRGARGLRQHALDRRAGRRRDRVRQGPAARLPAARGLRRRRRLPPAPHLRGGEAALGRPAARRGRRAARLRAPDHRRHGVLVVLPHRLGPHPPRPRAPRSGSAPAAARPPAARSPTACASPTSTRSATTCSSSAS